MQQSKYQRNITGTIQTSRSNIVVRSTAGSGKTTTIVLGCNYIGYGKRALFAAFNKHSVEDLKGKLPPGVDCSTLHSLGAKAIYGTYEQVKMNPDKQIGWIEPVFAREKENKKKWPKIYECDKLLSLVRATMTDFDREEIKKLAAKHNLFPDEEIVSATITAGLKMRRWTEDNTRNLIIDFQDMIELPVRMRSIRVPQYDFVFLDEAQDCSRLDQLFVERLLKPVKGRLIAVGDDRQAIYSFRGADINSFEYFKGRPNTVELPLTISYRCGKRIVENARTIYQEIEPWEDAIEGEVLKLGITESIVEKVEAGDIILCRNLRPLVDVFLRLIGNEKRATIIGKELEKDISALVNKLDNETTIPEMLQELEEQKLKLMEKLKLKGVIKPENHPKVSLFEEKAGILALLGEKCSDVGELLMLIDTIFSDEKEERDNSKKIRLMTIHKSKGLEADNVFVIERYDGKKLIPSQYAVTADQLKQEENLKFVAYTRAKKKLTLCEL